MIDTNAGIPRDGDPSRIMWVAGSPLSASRTALAPSECRVAGTGCQETLDTASSVFGVEQANRRIGQQRVRTHDTTCRICADEVLDHREGARWSGCESARELLGRVVQLIAGHDAVNHSPPRTPRRCVSPRLAPPPSRGRVRRAGDPLNAAGKRTMPSRVSGTASMAPSAAQIRSQNNASSKLAGHAGPVHPRESRKRHPFDAVAEINERADGRPQFRVPISAKSATSAPALNTFPSPRSTKARNPSAASTWRPIRARTDLRSAGSVQPSRGRGWVARLGAAR